MYPLPQGAIAQHIAVLGKTGSGKTSTAKLIVEQIVGAGFRACVLDPIKSDWWGIISSADGKAPGLPFSILGGPHQHVPLHSGAGAAIGELVATGRLPLSVLDMADFEPGGQSRFFCDFADALMRNMSGVLYLVLEEAHEFAPKERAGIGKENLALHYAKKLATAGRSKGIRLIVATQRTQSLHNAVLGSCETMIVHRLTAPADQLPVKNWLKANAPKNRKADVESSLSSLKTGTAWVCSGELALFSLTRFPRILTFDNSATPTKDSKRIQVKSAKTDLDALRSLIGDAVDEALEKDAKTLKARISELEAELRGADKIAAGDAEAAATYRAQLKIADERIRELERMLENQEKTIRALCKQFDRLKLQAAELDDELVKMGDLYERSRGRTRELVRKLVNRATPDPIEIPAESPTTTPARPRAKPAPPRDTNGTKLPKAQAAILRALYWLRDEDVTPAKVAFYSGYSAKSSSSANALSALRTAGFVVNWGITDEGAALIAKDAGEKPTGPELREWLRPRLSKAENAILDVLARAGGDRVLSSDLAGLAGYSDRSSSFANAISKLRSVGAADGYDRSGGARIADVFL